MGGDREYRRLLAASSLVGLALAVPLAVTLFPGELQRLLHGSDALGLACATFAYSIGEQLPPLGLGVLSVALLSALLVAWRGSRMLSRTQRVLSERRVVRAPGRLWRLSRRTAAGARIVCFTDPRPWAYCAGLVRPAIWISTGAVRGLGRDELEAVLLHESHHARRMDPLRLLVARLLASAFFTVPFIRDLAARFEVAAELEADFQVLAAQRNVAPLAGALYKLAAGRDRQPRRAVALGLWSTSQARVDHLSGLPGERVLPNPSRAARLLSAITLAIALALAAGQSFRASLFPASLMQAIAPAAEVHICPLPVEGILL
jgi:Zn-dependent protease with chaperone function